MKTENVILLLGSNLGKSEEILRKAIDEIKSLGFNLDKASSFYKTEPWGFTHQNYFLNIALCIQCPYSAETLLVKLLEIETRAGRIRNNDTGYTARTLDIDILFFNNTIIRSHELIIPHPRLHERNFALVPLCEIIPDFIHPVLNKTIAELKISCTDNGVVSKHANL